jgi:PrcB C-terminal
MRRLAALGIVRPVIRWVGCGFLAISLSGCTPGMAGWLAGEAPPSAVGANPSVVLASEGLVPLGGRALWRGETSRAQSQTFLVARAEAEWQALWRLAGRPAPGVMPEGLMALGIFIGTRPTTGYAVDIVRLRNARQGAERDRFVVDYREIIPRPSDGVTTAQSLTSPYAIMLVDRTDSLVRYNRLPQ